MMIIKPDEYAIIAHDIQKNEDNEQDGRNLFHGLGLGYCIFKNLCRISKIFCRI